LSMLDSQALSDTEVWRQGTEQDFEMIASMVYTKHFEDKKISLDDFLNDMTANKRRHTAIWTYTCLTSALPVQEVQKLDTDRAKKLYGVLKAQVLDTQSQPMAESILLAMIVSTVKGIPSLNDKLPETTDLLIQALTKSGTGSSTVGEFAGMLADQFGELKPLIDGDPKFKATLKKKLAAAASKSTNAQLKSLLLSLSTSL